MHGPAEMNARGEKGKLLFPSRASGNLVLIPLSLRWNVAVVGACRAGGGRGAGNRCRHLKELEREIIRT